MDADDSALGFADQPITIDIEDLAHELPAPDAPLGHTLDLQRCLLRLPADQRAVLLLVSLEGMSYQEIAQVTGVPIGTVMSRLSRARSRLQELLDAPAIQHADQQRAANVTPTSSTPLRRLK